MEEIVTLGTPSATQILAERRVAGILVTRYIPRSSLRPVPQMWPNDAQRHVIAIAEYNQDQRSYW